MQTYLFWATVRVVHKGEKVDERIVRGAHAENAFEARRQVLYKLINDGHQTIKIEPFD